MKFKVYTIWDAKVEAYQSPMMFRTKGEAIRVFARSVNDSQSNLSLHPEDYTLFEIGEYDDSVGRYTMHKDLIPCGRANEFKNVVQ